MSRRGEWSYDFRKAWSTACTKAGVPGRLRHDLRRTAVSAGVPERGPMKVTGHKTRAVFDRYHIVSPGDLQDVARRLAQASATKRNPPRARFRARWVWYAEAPRRK